MPFVSYTKTSMYSYYVNTSKTTQKNWLGNKGLLEQNLFNLQSKCLSYSVIVRHKVSCSNNRRTEPTAKPKLLQNKLYSTVLPGYFFSKSHKKENLIKLLRFPLSN